MCEPCSESCTEHLCKHAIYTHSHQFESPSLKKNGCSSLRQLDDPVYDEPSSSQPNYSSLDMKVVNDLVVNDRYNTEQHTNEVVNANKMEKAKKKSDVRNQQKTMAQEIPPNPTLVQDEASKKEDDFYDAEEHTYSVVNKKTNKKP